MIHTPDFQAAKCWIGNLGECGITVSFACGGGASGGNCNSNDVSSMSGGGGGDGDGDGGGGGGGGCGGHSSSSIAGHTLWFYYVRTC